MRVATFQVVRPYAMTGHAERSTYTLAGDG